MRKKSLVALCCALSLSLMACGGNVVIKDNNNVSPSAGATTVPGKVDGEAGKGEQSNKTDDNNKDDDNQSSNPSGENSGKDDTEEKAPKYALEDVAIEFSQVGGVYSNEFELSLSTEVEYDIYYTLDGSDPATSDTAIKYESPIKITDRKNDENVVSAVSPNLFCTNYSKYNRNTKTIECDKKAPSKEAVDKCTTVRAAVRNGDEASIPVGNSYFIGSMEEHISGLAESCKASGGSLAVISITMNYDDLFDHEKGIYVRGKVFDDALQAAIKKGGVDGEASRKYAANYNQRGREWERDAHMEMYEVSTESATQVLEQNCGIRIQGNYSRSDLQKSFRLYARKDYGKKKFGYPIWGDEAQNESGETIEKYKNIVLRAGGNCAFTAKYNDTFWQDLASECAVSTKASRPCVVYLNGEYWGLYVLEEDYSDDYFETHYGVDKESVIVYKGDAETYKTGYKLDIGSVEAGQPEPINELTEFFSKHNSLKSKADYDEFAKLVDVESVMDYFAIESWINNKWDWPGKNWSMWKATESADPENPSDYADGRWRLMLYDVEFGGVSGSGDAGVNTIKEDNYKKDGLLDMGTTNPAVLCFAYLMTNPSFNIDFCNRLEGLSTGCFEKELAQSVLSSYEKEYGPLFDQFFNRYSGTGSKNDALYGGYASSKCIRDFLDRRAGNISKLTDFCKKKLT